MSFSRMLTIIAALGAAISAIAGSLEVINPKWAAIATLVGTFIAAFNERIQGGASKFDDDPEE